MNPFFLVDFDTLLAWLFFHHLNLNEDKFYLVGYNANRTSSKFTSTSSLRDPDFVVVCHSNRWVHFPPFENCLLS
jgi:hypothetical protein